MKRTPTLLLFVAFTALSACTSQAQTLRDDPEFRTMHNPVISDDAAWVAAEERPDRGDGNVRVWSTEGDVTFSIERGQNPRISRDSRWVSVLQKLPFKESKTAKPKKKRAGQTLVLLNTQSGLTRTFEFVLSYDVTYSSSWLVYLQSPEPKADEGKPSKDNATNLAAKPVAKERKAGTLHTVHLKSDAAFTIASVAEHATHEGSDHVACVLHDKATGRDQLRIVALGPGTSGIRAMRDGEKIEGLRWAREVTTVGFFDSAETKCKDGKPRVKSALYMWHVEGPGLLGEFTRVKSFDRIR